MHPTLLFCLHQTILLVNERESLPYWWLNHFWTNPSFIFLLYTFQVGNDHQQTQCHECYVTCKYNLLLTNRAWPIPGHRSLPISVTASQNDAFLYTSDGNGAFRAHVEGKFNFIHQILQRYTPKQFVLIFQTKWTWLRKHTSPTDEFHLRWKQSQIAFFVASTKLSGIYCVYLHIIYIYMYIQSFIFIDTNNKYTL